MRTYPTGKTGRHARILIQWLAAGIVAGSTVATAASPTSDLQRLGARVQAAAIAQERGVPLSPHAIDDLKVQLAASHWALNADGGRTLESKYRAIALLLAHMEFTAAHGDYLPAGAPAVRISREVLGPAHGTLCKSALGLSEHAATQVMIGSADGPQRDAWLHFEPAHDGAYRFTTHSEGPDPSLEILVGGCGHTRAAGANDDAIGLDAEATVVLRRGDPVLVHVVNSAQGGPLTIEAASSDTTIAGMITDADTGQPIADASVAAVSSTLYYTWVGTSTDQTGHYLVSVNPGSYYVQVADNNGYVSELYPNAPCQYGSYYINISVCNKAEATVLTPTIGEAITGIDVALGHGQQIAGSVRNGANQAIANANVALYSATGQSLANAYTDSVGRYTFTTVPSFAYKLVAQAGGFGSQLYDHVACGGPLQTQCDLNQATALNVPDHDVTGVNFSLPTLATIQGTVTGASAYGAQVCVMDSQGNAVASCASIDGTGHYSAGPLPVGTFYAYVTATGFFSQIYNGVDCPQDCTQSIPLAAAIVLSQPGQVGSANFVLTPLPTVHGHVQDSISGLPLANVGISASVLPPAGYTTSSTTTDGNGDYALANTPAGVYYLLAVSNDHIDQIYSAIPCEQYNSGYYYPTTACDVSGATLLTIAPGNTPATFNFALAPSSAVSGKARVRAGPGSDIPAVVEVHVYNTAGQDVASASSDALGNYVVNDLVAGTYYAETASSYYAYYINQVWNQVDCPTVCAAMTGLPIIVGNHVTVPGIDFELTRRDAVVGRVRSDSGAPLQGVIVDLFESTTSHFSGSGISDALGFYAAPASVGANYFVATEVGSGYVDQVYANISCPLGPAYFGDCAFGGAAAIGLSPNGVQPRIVDFTIYTTDTIFAGNFDD